MHDLTMSPDPQRTRFFALLALDCSTPLLIEPEHYNDSLLYLHFLALPDAHWKDYTLKFGSLRQLADALSAPATVDFLGARIAEVWHWNGQLLRLLRALPYTELVEDMIGPPPLADQELPASLLEFADHHPPFTSELAQVFLRLFAAETSRHRLGDLLHAHAERELHRILRAGFLHPNLFGHGESQVPLVQALARLEQMGLLVQESLSPVVRLRFLPSQPVAKKQGESKLR